MADSSSSIRRIHRLTYFSEEVQDPLPSHKAQIPQEIINQLDLIFNNLLEQDYDIIQGFQQILAIINEYGHDIHPYITSINIQKLITFLDTKVPANYWEPALQILWSCSFLSSDIFGYFMEADSFITRLSSILQITQDKNIVLLVIYLLRYCIKKNNDLTNEFAFQNIFHKLLPFCNGPTQFMPICVDIIICCQITQEFVKAAAPLMFQIIETGDDFSIANILNILANSNREEDEEDCVNHYIMNNYLPRLCSFLESTNEFLVLNTITMFSSISMVENGIVEYIVTSDILDRILKVLFHDDKTISFAVIDFLEGLLITDSIHNCIDSFMNTLLKYNFLEFSKVCCFVVREKLAMFFIEAIVLANPREVEQLVTPDFLEAIIQMFESTNISNKRTICSSLNRMLISNEMNPEFCQAVQEIWTQNDVCVNFCPDLTIHNLNTHQLE